VQKPAWSWLHLNGMVSGISLVVMTLFFAQLVNKAGCIFCLLSEQFSFRVLWMNLAVLAPDINMLSGGLVAVTVYETGCGLSKSFDLVRVY
jgi:hypothetical protein